MKAFIMLLLLLSCAGCTTYEATNRILVCFGFCALQGVQLVKAGDEVAVVVPPDAKVKESKAAEQTP